MIIGDSVTCGGCAFHPSIAEPPISIEDDEEQDEEDSLSMDPSTAQHLVVSALATASAATGAHSPHPNTFSPLPTTSSLVNKFHVPDDMMEVDPMPKMTGDYISPSTTPLDDFAISPSGGIKRKLHPTVHSTPASVISAAHSAPTTFTPSSSDPLLSLSLGTKRHKASSSGTPVSLHPSSSSGTRGRSRSGAQAKPSQRKSSRADVNHQIAEFTETLDRMTDAMETQNLIFQVPIPPPVDQATQACSRVIAAIQQDVSGTFTTEERGKIINYIITNPAAATTYEQLADDGHLLRAWLSTALSN